MNRPPAVQHHARDWHVRAKRDLGVVFDPGISVRALAGLVDQIAAERGAGVPSHGRNHAVLLGDHTILAKLHMLVHLDPAVSPDQQPPQPVHIPFCQRVARRICCDRKRCT